MEIKATRTFSLFNEKKDENSTDCEGGMLFLLTT